MEVKTTDPSALMTSASVTVVIVSSSHLVNIKFDDYEVSKS